MWRHASGLQAKTRIIITWTALLVTLVLGVLAVFFWSWLRPRMVAGPVVDAGQDSTMSMETRKASAFQSPPEQIAVRIVKEALALRDPVSVDAYFRRDSAEPATVIAFLAGMEEKDGPVTGLQWLSSIDANNMLLDGVLVSTMKDGSPRSRIALLTPDEKGVWKIDFDAFARTVKPSWDELLAAGKGEGLVRVIVAKDSYYNGVFRDETQWMGYGMISPDIAGTILSGYCRKDSPQQRAMERILAGEKTENGSAPPRLSRATLEVRRPQGAESRQFEIIRVLAEDWVLGDEPFDKTSP